MTHRAWTGALLLLLSSSVVGAQEKTQQKQVKEKQVAQVAPGQPGEPVELPEEVVTARKATTATRTDVPLRQVPQSVDVVPRGVLDDLGSLRLQDALERSVGAMGFDTGESNHDEFRLRGFEVATLRDGVREQPGYVRNLSDVERVEVLRGPASVLYGRGEAGGSINLISKEPLTEPLHTITLGATSFFRDRDSGFFNRGGIYDNLLVSADLGGPVRGEQLFYRLTAYLDSSDGWRDFVNHEDRDLAFSLRWLPTDESSLTVRLAYYDRNLTHDRGLIGVNGAFPDVHRTTYYGSRGNLTTNNQFTLSPVYEIQVNDDLLVRNSVQFVNHQRREVSLRPRRVEDNFIGPFGGTAGSDGEFETVEREQRHIDSDEWELTEQLEALWNVPIGGFENDFLFGLEATLVDTQKEDFRLRDSDTLTDPVFHTPWLDPQANVETIEADINHPLAASKSDRDFEGRYLALYAQDLLAVAEPLKVLLNARLERYDEELTNPLNSTNPSQGVSETIVGGRAGVVYTPVEWTSLYGVVSRGYRPRGLGAPFVSDLERSDGKDFEIEENLLYEIGDRSTFLDDRLAVTISLFQQERNDFTTVDPDTGLTEQIGELRSRGVEITAEGRISDEWSVRAFYALTDAEFRENFSGGVDLSGNTPSMVPDNTFGVWMTYDIEGPLRFGGGARWVDERFANDQNSSTLDSYFVVDAFASCKVGDSGKVLLSVKNLFDEDYFVSGTRFGDFALPGAPFNATISYALSF